MEQWRPVNGYEGLYEVSNLGRIKSLSRLDSCGRKRKERILKPQYNSYGYTRVYLLKDGKGIRAFRHRVVAKAFINNLEDKKEVNHKNGIKDDNRVSNLEWTTSKENTRHAYKTGLVQSRFGVNNSNCKLDNTKAAIIRCLISKNVGAKAISEEFNISISTIRNIKNNKSWKKEELL